MIFSCFLLEVLWFKVCCLGVQYILHYFLCIMWGMAQSSIFCIWMYNFVAPCVGKTIFPPLNCLLSLSTSVVHTFVSLSLDSLVRNPCHSYLFLLQLTCLFLWLLLRFYNWFEHLIRTCIDVPLFTFLCLDFIDLLGFVSSWFLLSLKVFGHYFFNFF